MAQEFMDLFPTNSGWDTLQRGREPDPPIRQTGTVRSEPMIEVEVKTLEEIYSRLNELTYERDYRLNDFNLDTIADIRDMVYNLLR